MSTTQSARPKALIIGGSLGGLLTANTLRAIGWDVEVFERSKRELDSRGGGLVLQPDVRQALNFAGIDPPQEFGVESDDRIILDAEDHVIQRQHMPQTQTSWNTLYGILKRALPSGLVHAGEQFSHFEETREGVMACFESGRIASGDLLIGADGARSSVRERLLSGIAPRYAGYVAWRGLAPEAGLSPAVGERLGQAFAFQQGDDDQFLQYLVPGEDGSTHAGSRRRNWVWYRRVAPGGELERVLTDRDGIRHTFSLPPGTAAEVVLAEMRRAAQSRLAPTFQRLVAATEEPFLQAILDLQVPKMVFGRAVLVGDAAFVPRPHTGAGAGKAAANALALARSLHAFRGRIPLALERWETSQLAAGRAMCEWGISVGNRLMGITREKSAAGTTGVST